jgi:DNA polymerase III subunit beta
MKFNCLQENLSFGIQAAGHLAQRTTNLPVLSNVHLKAEKNGIVLSSTNLESGVQQIVRGKVDEEGECLIPARLLLDLLPLLSSGAMSVSDAAGGLNISTENTSTTIRTIPTAEFPIIPTIDASSPSFALTKDQLFKLLNGVMVAAGKVEQRPQFNGVYVTNQKNKLVAAATDGFRLAEGQLDVANLPSFNNFIIPLVSAQEVVRIFSLGGDSDEQISIHISDNQAQFKTSTTTLITRLIDGEYPDYSSLFPDNSPTSLVLNTSSFVKGIKAATLFSRSGMSDVTLNVEGSRHSIEIFSENSNVGSHQTSLPVEGEGEELRVVLNSRYLLDGLQTLATAQARLNLTTPDRPILILPEPITDLNYRYLIMPIRQ